jgi:S-(hydroxymethyl)glutathione dehydrogenase / alcohol dehydrogenase
MSKYIKSAILTHVGKPLKIIRDIVYENLSEGQLLVKIKYAGLCHSQLMEVKGHRGEDKYLPHMLGHEGVGTVVSVGPNVTKFVKGDDVVLGWLVGDGLEGGAKIYSSETMGVINAGAVTAFSDYAVISENRLYKKPATTPDHLAVLYGCALPTGVGLVINDMKPTASATIAVVGLGGIGLSALMACQEYFPKQLIAIDVEESKLDLARTLGAHITINSLKEDVVNKILSLTNGKGVDYCVEAAGLTSTIELGFSLIKRNGGELIFASHPKSGDLIQIDPFELISGKSIRGSWGGASKPDRDIEIMGKMYERGILKLDQLISHSYVLDDINAALNDLDQRKIVRALIDINSSRSSDGSDL